MILRVLGTLVVLSAIILLIPALTPYTTVVTAIIDDWQYCQPNPLSSDGLIGLRD